MVKPAKDPRWERRPDERPEELLTVALSVFLARGYRATRLEEIAEVAGVTRGTIYYYFDGKEDLLQQAIETRIKQVFATLQEESRPVGDSSASDQLRATLRAAWKRWRHPQTGALYRLITGELRTEFPRVFVQAMRMGPLLMWQVLGEIIANGQRRGEFDGDVDAPSAARFIASGLMQQAFLTRDLQEQGLDESDADQLFDTAVTMALRALVPRPAATGTGASRPPRTKPPKGR